MRCLDYHHIESSGMLLYHKQRRNGRLHLRCVCECLDLAMNRGLDGGFRNRLKNQWNLNIHTKKRYWNHVREFAILSNPHVVDFPQNGNTANDARRVSCVCKSHFWVIATTIYLMLTTKSTCHLHSLGDDKIWLADDCAMTVIVSRWVFGELSKRQSTYE